MTIIQRRAERHLMKLKTKHADKLTKAAYLFADSLEEGDQAGRFRFTTRDGRPLVILAALDVVALGLIEEEEKLPPCNCGRPVTEDAACTGCGHHPLDCGCPAVEIGFSRLENAEKARPVEC